MKTSEKILQLIEKEKEVTAKQLIDYLGISERAVFKQLSKLIESGDLSKIGKPPKVFYKINTSKETTEDINFDKNTEDILEQNFLYITPLGEYFPGKQGFVKWCKARNFDSKSQASQYKKTLKEINKKRKNGVIVATDKFRDSFDKIFLDKVFYIDFYSVPHFGKTKLGQLLLYAKQSQDIKRIKGISKIAKNPINYIIEKYKIDAIGFIPPTVKREVQFMKELEKNLGLNLPKLKITKVKTDIVVPQKTLNKLKDRIINARNTIMIEDTRRFDSVLLIDDAVGSGATFNETARKILDNNVAKKVFGLSITGSYKGFDVISEV